MPSTFICGFKEIHHIIGKPEQRLWTVPWDLQNPAAPDCEPKPRIEKHWDSYPHRCMLLSERFLKVWQEKRGIKPVEREKNITNIKGFKKVTYQKEQEPAWISDEKVEAWFNGGQQTTTLTWGRRQIWWCVPDTQTCSCGWPHRRHSTLNAEPGLLIENKRLLYIYLKKKPQYIICTMLLQYTI